MRNAKTALLVLFTFAVLASATAGAAVISVAGKHYEVTKIDAIYTPQLRELVLSSQPWWEDSALAAEFATATNSQLGLVFADWGPLFAYEENDASNQFSSIIWMDGAGDTNAVIQPTNLQSIMPFAVVSEVPLPAAAWLFGSALFSLGVFRARASSNRFRFSALG